MIEEKTPTNLNEKHCNFIKISKYLFQTFYLKRHFAFIFIESCFYWELMNFLLESSLFSLLLEFFVSFLLSSIQLPFFVLSDSTISFEFVHILSVLFFQHSPLVLPFLELMELSVFYNLNRNLIEKRILTVLFSILPHFSPPILEMSTNFAFGFSFLIFSRFSFNQIMNEQGGRFGSMAIVFKVFPKDFCKKVKLQNKFV